MRSRGKRQRVVHSTPWGLARGRTDLSIRDLADLSGVPVAVLSYLERGQYVPTPDEAARVLAALRDAPPAREQQPITV